MTYPDEVLDGGVDCSGPGGDIRDVTDVASQARVFDEVLKVGVRSSSPCLANSFVSNMAMFGRNIRNHHISIGRDTLDSDNLTLERGQGSRRVNDGLSGLLSQLTVGVIASIFGKGAEFQSESTGLGDVGSAWKRLVGCEVHLVVGDGV